LQLEKS